MGDDGSDAARSRGVPIGLAGVAFVADDSARLNVGPDIEQGFEVTPVGNFTAELYEARERILDMAEAVRSKRCPDDPKRRDSTALFILKVADRAERGFTL